MARVKANLRRVADDSVPQQQNDVIKCADLEIDVNRYEVRRDGNVIELTLREFELVKFLGMQKVRYLQGKPFLKKFGITNILEM